MTGGKTAGKKDHVGKKAEDTGLLDPDYEIMEDIELEEPICPICLDPCERPTIVARCCGTTYCRSCLTQWLQTPAASCPNCRQNPTDTTIEDDIVLVEHGPRQVILVERNAILPVSPRVVLGGIAIGTLTTVAVFAYEIHSAFM